MRLYQKLVLFMLVAAVGPVAVVGFALLGNAEKELRARITEAQLAGAATAADLAARDVDEAVESLSRTAAPIRWEALSTEEKQGALQLLVGQSRHFAAAMLLDGKGRELAPAALPGKEKLDFKPLLAALPFAELKDAAPGTVAMSGVFARWGWSAAALGMSVAGEGEGWVVAVELALRASQERAAASAQSAAGELWLYDATGRALAAPHTDRLGSKVPEGLSALADSLAQGPQSTRLEINAEMVLASAARVPGRLGWWALVIVPEKTALAPVSRMRTTVLGSIGGALAMLLAFGFLFTRTLSRRIEAVALGARAFGTGDLAKRVPESGADEVAELARSFNAMGGELLVARKKLERWNEELQQKVDERTAELKAAQAALLEAQKLAAIGQLGAGVAHEINNPLAGILGNAQLLLLDRPESDRDVALLKKIESLAKRAKEITANLLRFSQQRAQAEARPIDLNKLVPETLTLVETQIHAEGIELVHQSAPGPAKVSGDAGHLAQLLLNLVSNARTAMLKSASKRLTVSTAVEGDQVLLKVADTGKGISDKDLPRIFEPFFTTKDVWSNVGLGLSVSFRIVSEHKGRIDVATAVGKGSTFTVSLPAVK